MFTRYCFRNRQTNIFRVFTEKETDCGIVIVWCSADCILFPRWQGVEIQRCNTVCFWYKSGLFYTVICGTRFDKNK